jgi:16S rRNA (adenine1518-N6/adenine1519-N6)-dimethyltransferase
MSFKHKKKYGQNFLTDAEEVLGKIMDVAQVGPEESIVEIGPGEGALTKLLLETANDVTCIEIDSDLEKVLMNKFSKNPKFKLVMQDILEVNFDEEIGKKVKVVANIPYYITSPIINKLIENRRYVEEVYIMVQKEVAERICAKSGKERSILTLAVEYFADAEYLFTIPKEAFTPVPKVDSAFMSIKIRQDNPYEEMLEEKLFFKYVKAAFANKRKNIVNNLSMLGFEKEKLREALEENGVNPKKRAEAFSIDEFMELIKILERVGR